MSLSLSFLFLLSLSTTFDQSIQESKMLSKIEEAVIKANKRESLFIETTTSQDNAI